VVVRREAPADRSAVRALHDTAFADSPRRDGVAVEARLVDALRADAGWLPRLSLVADDAGEVVGHVVCTRGWLEPEPAKGADGERGLDRERGADDAGRRPVLGLGPLGVLPAWQRRGIGSALVHAVCAAAEAEDERLVVLLGSPAFYGRLGFGPAAAAGVIAPEPSWGEHFQVRRLAAGDVAGDRGRFRYAAPFDAL